MGLSRFYIIAGESSGDLYGAELVREIKNLTPGASFYGFGGPEMQKSGVEISRSIDKLELIGFTEVVLKAGTVLQNFKIAKKDLIRIKPDALILIDYPGFNLRMAEWAKNRGIKVFYYIAPQTWAWKASRNEKIKKFVDKLFVILPFEENYFNKNGIPAEFVGHPMVDQIENFKSSQKAEIPVFSQISDKKIIAILPGSRSGEISKMTPYLINMIKNMPDKHFVIAALSKNPKSLYEAFKHFDNVQLIYDKTLDVLQVADFGLIKSGTSTLQAALLKLPHVVFYKVSPISGWIMKKLATIKFAALPNLILNRLVVPELLQEELTSANLEFQLRAVMEESKKEAQILSFDLLESKLKKDHNSAQLVAQAIVSAIE